MWRVRLHLEEYWGVYLLVIISFLLAWWLGGDGSSVEEYARPLR